MVEFSPIFCPISFESSGDVFYVEWWHLSLSADGFSLAALTKGLSERILPLQGMEIIIQTPFFSLWSFCLSMIFFTFPNQRNTCYWFQSSQFSNSVAVTDDFSVMMNVKISKFLKICFHMNYKLKWQAPLLWKVVLFLCLILRLRFIYLFILLSLYALFLL